MALANVAWILASNGQRVLVVDWDLEAPGLHRYFRPFLRDKELTGPDSQGVIDFVVDFSVQLATPASSRIDEKWYENYADISKWSKRLTWPSGEIVNLGTKGLIDFVPAGQQGPQYGKKVNSFDWANFYEQLNGGTFFDAVRRSMANYDWVLIDSRTGVSDTAGICTMQFPDILVVCFTLNYQSIEGAFTAASAVKKARPEISIWPVPTRIDGSEEKLLRRMKEYAKSKFTTLLNRYVEPEKYWYTMEVPYFPRYAYSEKLAPFEDQTGISTSTLPAMERLTDWITSGRAKKLGSLPEADRKESLAEFEAPPGSQHVTGFGEYLQGSWISRLLYSLKYSFLELKRTGLQSLLSAAVIIFITLAINYFSTRKDTMDTLLDSAQKDLQSKQAGTHDHAALLLAEAAKQRQDKSASPLDPGNKTDARLLDLFYSLGPLQSGFIRHNAPVNVVRFNPDGTRVVTASADKTSRIFSADGSSLPAWGSPNGDGWAVDFSPDGKYLAVGGLGGAYIFDAQSLRYLFSAATSGPVQRLAFSPNSQNLLTAANGEVVLFNLVPFKRAARFLKYKGIQSLAFSPDSARFAESTMEGVVVVSSTEPPGKYSQILTGHNADVRMVRFTPDGQLLATASADGTVILWNQRGQMLLRLLIGADVYAIAFSPDGKLLATGSLDGTARIWSIPSGSQLGAVKYLADVRALDFSPDGKWLATGSGDGTARIFEVATLKELQKITYSAEVNSVAFSRDQKYLAVASSDGTAATWLALPNGSRLPSLTPAQMMSLACRQVTGNVFISQVEWAQYFGKEAYQPVCKSQNLSFGSGQGFNGSGAGGPF